MIISPSARHPLPQTFGQSDFVYVSHARILLACVYTLAFIHTHGERTRGKINRLYFVSPIVAAVSPYSEKLYGRPTSYTPDCKVPSPLCVFSGDRLVVYTHIHAREIPFCPN